MTTTAISASAPADARKKADSQRPASPIGRFLLLVPGLVILLGIGYSGKFIEAWIKGYGKSHGLTLPNIEYVLWAILIGAVIGNLFGGRTSVWRMGGAFGG